MHTENPLVQPHHCFCEIPEAQMQPWIIKKFKEHISTLALMQSTDDPSEKEIISIVALIDLDDITMLKMMEAVDLPQEHILECRLHAKQLVDSII